MMKHLLTALLILLPAAADADDWARSGQVSGTSIVYGITADGRYFFANTNSPGAPQDALSGWMKPVGSAFIGETNMRSNAKEMTFYRPDLNMMIDLETGVVCWDVGKPTAWCK